MFKVGDKVEAVGYPRFLAAGTKGVVVQSGEGICPGYPLWTLKIKWDSVLINGGETTIWNKPEQVKLVEEPKTDEALAAEYRRLNDERQLVRNELIDRGYSFTSYGMSTPNNTKGTKEMNDSLVIFKSIRKEI